MDKTNLKVFSTNDPENNSFIITLEKDGKIFKVNLDKTKIDTYEDLSPSSAVPVTVTSPSFPSFNKEMRVFLNGLGSLQILFDHLISLTEKGELTNGSVDHPKRDSDRQE